MTWLVEQRASQRDLSDRFQRLVNAPGVLKVPGCHDALTGLIAREAGFAALYLSGAGYAATRGLPDLGLTSAREVAERARELVSATGLPVLVDIDTGFGGVLDCARAGREMGEAGVAAVQIEDQDLPKKCGHLTGKRLIPAEDMMAKIRMLKEAAPTVRVVARTDAAAVEGLGAAVERARAYVAAGADVIFPEALETEEAFRLFAASIEAPLLANLTEFGRSPLLGSDVLADMGYRVAIYPVTALRMAAFAIREAFAEIQSQGTQEALLGRMQTRRELYDLIRYPDYESLDQRIAQSRLPGEQRPYGGGEPTQRPFGGDRA